MKNNKNLQEIINFKIINYIRLGCVLGSEQQRKYRKKRMVNEIERKIYTNV